MRMQLARLMRRVLVLLPCLGLLGAQAAPPAAVFTDFRYEGAQPGQKGLKVTHETFLNPIIAGSRSDPTLTRVGRDFYMSHTSFGDWPGAPIWRSRDLVHWRLIGHAFTHPDAPDLSKTDPAWQGVWTNDLKHHDGWFYMSGICYACGRVFVMRARDPAGPWPKPTFLPMDAVDASFFFDDDGRSYITYSGIPTGGSRYEGHRAIWLQEIDPASLALKGEPALLVEGGTHPPEKPFWLEGEHLFKKDGRYYLIAAQGGTNENHSEVVFRSDALRGPYVAGPNPILTQEGLDPGRPNAVANTGHADFVQTPGGEWWSVFLGARPYGRDARDFATGRDTFLLPVAWRDGWPMILPPGQAVPVVVKRPKLPDAPVADWPTAGDYAVTDRFGGPQLSPRWSILRTSGERWLRTGAGGLRVTPRAVELGAKEGQPSFVGLRQAHIGATATVTVRFHPSRPGERAGLATVQDERRWFFLAVVGAAGGRREVRLIRRGGPTDPAEGVVAASAPAPGGRSAPVRLRVEVEGPVCRFDYAAAGAPWRAIGPTQDCAILSNRIAKGFTGVMIGPAAIAAPAA